MRSVNFLLILIIFLNTSCYAKENTKHVEGNSNKGQTESKEVVVGAARITEYISLIKDKNIALVVNQTSMIDDEHLVDVLLRENIHIKNIFAPEHGFRGKADAGEKIKDGIDLKSNLPIISLYGSHKKPTDNDLKDIDIVVFDIQDVGARFYTYISTLHYVMEACAENKIKILVLDRPNPNGHYVDGNVLEKKFTSFVGMHPIPVVHGMTMAEYASMINGEKWLKDGIHADLEVVLCKNYDRNIPYDLPIKPSPNLPNTLSINLYPSLCFFEGTQISIGRGTEIPFQVIGAPSLKSFYHYTFTPVSTSGAKFPKHKDEVCYGRDMSDFGVLDSLNIELLLEFYENFQDKENFFLENNFIDKLAGTDKLRKSILAGKTAKEIKKSWQDPLNLFKEKRKKYLLY